MEYPRRRAKSHAVVSACCHARMQVYPCDFFDSSIWCDRGKPHGTLPLSEDSAAFAAAAPVELAAGAALLRVTFIPLPPLP